MEEKVYFLFIFNCYLKKKETIKRLRELTESQTYGFSNSTLNSANLSLLSEVTLFEVHTSYGYGPDSIDIQDEKFNFFFLPSVFISPVHDDRT